MQISTAFPSRYIKSHDLDDQEIKVTINTVTMEQVGMGGDQQPVVYFRGWQKGMVLNKTNGRKIASLFGDDTDKWKGNEIILYAAQTQFQGEQMMGLRVKAVTERLDQEMPQQVTAKHMLNKMRAADIQTERKPANPETLPWDDQFPANMPNNSILVEAEAMARGGIQSFRSWRDALNQDELEKIKPIMEKLISIAHAHGDGINATAPADSVATSARKQSPKGEPHA